MIGSNLVVTVRDDEKGAQFADTPAEEPHQIERSAVRPMGVLTDQERRAWTRGEGREHGPEERFAALPIEGESVDLESKCRRQVTDGTEWTRRGERVARRTQGSRRPGHPPAELVDQRGLADTGLAADEDHSSLPGRGQPQVLLELGQEWFALE